MNFSNDWVGFKGMMFTLTITGIAPDDCDIVVDSFALRNIPASDSTKPISTNASFTRTYELGFLLKHPSFIPMANKPHEVTKDTLTKGYNINRPFATLSRYYYTYNMVRRRIIRTGKIYVNNTRCGLANAANAMGDSACRCAYIVDDIGNRETSAERHAAPVNYTANNLNQYTAIHDFTPTYDADGNQTTIKTKTGIWQVTYNGENRPIRWEQIADAEGNRIVFNATIVTMTYDRMGRRVTKTTTQPDTNTTRAETFVYDGYLQVANQSTISNQITQQFYIWDPTEPVATRPLVWNREGNETAFYLHDGNKNVSDVISASGEILAHYTYAPFGDCAALGSSALSNPWRFSSEYADDEIGCVYYNYRHYEPTMGRWFVFDFSPNTPLNFYLFVNNLSIILFDQLGLAWGNGDALRYFFFGNGTSVCLDEIGHADRIKKIIQPIRSNWHSKVEKMLLNAVNKFDICKERNSFVVSETEGVNSGVFWIGGFNLYKYAKCDIIRRCGYNSYYISGECEVWYLMEDEFRDPSDFDNSNGSDFWDHWNYGGTPFFVHSRWNDLNVKIEKVVNRCVCEFLK